jgi:hypothetical protein
MFPASRAGEDGDMKSVLVAAALLMEGCTLMPSDTTEWLPGPLHPALRPYHIEVGDDALAGACGNPPTMHLRLHGCALRVTEERLCIIYTKANPASWVMEHERKHCAGWDHA